MKQLLCLRVGMWERGSRMCVLLYVSVHIVLCCTSLCWAVFFLFCYFIRVTGYKISVLSKSAPCCHLFVCVCVCVCSCVCPHGLILLPERLKPILTGVEPWIVTHMDTHTDLERTPDGTVERDGCKHRHAALGQTQTKNISLISESAVSLTATLPLKFLMVYISGLVYMKNWDFVGKYSGLEMLEKSRCLLRREGHLRLRWYKKSEQPERISF